MTAHANCQHPNTKAARAACRRATKGHREVSYSNHPALKTRPSDAAIDRERRALDEALRDQGGHYNSYSLAETRYWELIAELETGDSPIMLKPPSGYEVTFSRWLGLHLKQHCDGAF